MLKLLLALFAAFSLHALDDAPLATPQPLKIYYWVFTSRPAIPFLALPAVTPLPERFGVLFNASGIPADCGVVVFRATYKTPDSEKIKTATYVAHPIMGLTTLAAGVEVGRVKPTAVEATAECFSISDARVKP